MANELQLVLEKDITELTPAMIAWNNEELMAKVKAKLQEYEGKTYSEEDIGQAKKDRAMLNNFCIALNNERIRIGKIYNAPYENFKKQVDEVNSVVKNVSGKIDEQIKAYDLAKAQEKEGKIKEYFDSVIGDYAKFISFDKIFQQKWLNATVKLDTVCKDIDALIQNANNALTAIEALNSPDEDLVKAYYFRSLDLSAALTEAARLKQDREEAARLKELREQQKKAAEEKKAQFEAPATAPVSATVAPEPPKAPAVEYLTIQFEVTATREDFCKLKTFLIENGIKYSAIGR